MGAVPQSLCLTCGICCDGTLFSNVFLKPDDDITVLETIGVTIVSDREFNILKLPCAAHKGACVAYQHRPQRCREYKCELLKRFERYDISYEDALRIITKAICLRNEFKASALAALINAPKNEIALRVHRWLADLDSIVEIKHSFPRVFLKFITLQLYLDRFFRRRPAAKAVIKYGLRSPIARPMTLAILLWKLVLQLNQRNRS